MEGWAEEEELGRKLRRRSQRTHRFYSIQEKKNILVLSKRRAASRRYAAQKLEDEAESKENFFKTRGFRYSNANGRVQWTGRGLRCGSKKIGGAPDEGDVRDSEPTRRVKPWTR